jgi:catechol 2,3-dioxygenase
MAKNPHYISHLGHVELYSPNVDESVKFFKEVIGLEESGRDGKSVYLRAWGEYYHHSLVITDNNKAGLGHIGWRADSAEALEEAVKHLEGTGLGRGWIEGCTGHGKAYRFESPDGHVEEIFWDVELYQAPEDQKSVWRNRPQRRNGRGVSPRRIDHVTIHSTNVKKCREFYQGLGFYFREGILLDGPETEIGAWLSVTNLSHDIAILGETSGQRGLFNHVCYAVESREEVLIAADHLIENGYKLVMGAPTRHKIAEGFFFYVDEPGGGNRFELYAGAHLIFAPDFGPYWWKLSENPNDAWGNVMPWTPEGDIVLFK